MQTQAIQKRSLCSRSAASRRSCPVLDIDIELMLRMRSGDADAFAMLLSRHWMPVKHYLRRSVRNASVAEELAQEVFLRVYRSRNSYVPAAKFTTWLYRITSRVAINWVRRQPDHRMHGTLDDSSAPVYILQLRDAAPSVEDRLLTAVWRGEIRDAIADLPTNQRMAVMQHKFEDLSYAQIASNMNCTESAVKSLLFRAYGRLRSRLLHLAR
jgi:RNA polymerase sigma-70 factor (ECF subfamily)